jgi:hypothetical protein
MPPPISESYHSPVKNSQPQNVSTSKTVTTALSEHSGYKEPTHYEDYMKIKKMSSDAKSFDITKLMEEPKQSDLLSTSSQNVGNQSASKAELQFKRFDRIDDPFVLDVQSSQKPLSNEWSIKASKFNLSPRIEGDRFIPTRNEEMYEVLERKIEIESRPPENLHEDSRLEATPA